MKNNWSEIWETLLNATEASLSLKPEDVVRYRGRVATITSYVYLDEIDTARVDIRDLSDDTTHSVDPSDIEIVDHLTALAEQAE